MSLNMVDFHYLDYGTSGRRSIGISCPTCLRELRKDKKQLTCPHCGLVMTRLRIFAIPDDHGLSWIHVFYWVEPARDGQGPQYKLHWRPVHLIKADEGEVIREMVMRPLINAWHVQLIREGRITPEQAVERLKVLLYGGELLPEDKPTAPEAPAAGVQE